MKASATKLVATTYELTDKEFDKFDAILRRELRRYLQDKLGAAKVTELDTTRNTKALRLYISKLLTNPEFASVVASYVSLRSQEKQAKTNFRLQCMIIGLAALSAFTSILQLILHH